MPLATAQVYHPARLTRLFETVVGGAVVAILGAIANYIFQIRGNWTIVNIGQFILWAQCIALLALTLLSISLRPWTLPSAQRMGASEAEYNSAKEATSEFIAYWQLVWLSLFIFYFVSAIGWGAGTSTPMWAKAINHVSYIASTTFMLLSYFVLTTKSAEAEDKLEWNRLRFITGLFSFFIILILFIPDVLPFFSAPPLSEPLRIMAGDALDLLPNLFCGAVLALFVGRLESKFFGTPRWIVIALFCYALLQVAYVEPINPKDHVSLLVLARQISPKALSDRADLSTVIEQINLKYLTVVSLSLFFKILLFWEVRRRIGAGTLTEYMFKYRRLLDEKR